MKKSDWLFILVMGLLFAGLRLFVFFAATVDGHSMDPTLATGDRGIVLMHKKPKRFDIVTLDSHDEEEKIYIKRVIGLPGEHLIFQDGKLWVDGKEYQEPYLDKKLVFDNNGRTLTGNFEVDVPKDSYFVLGDNRGNSRDSRVLGSISKKDIDGVFVWRFWPLNRVHVFH